MVNMQTDTWIDNLCDASTSESWQFDICFKVYMTDFFICSIKFPQCTDKYSKNSFSIAIFLPRVLMYQKRQISLPVGYKTKNRRLRTIVTSFQDYKLREKTNFSDVFLFSYNNALSYHFLATWLAHNKKMIEKSVFREAWSPQLTSQSFPVSFS